jgi:hypothetical protein
MSRGGNAELLGHLDIAAAGAMRNVAGTSDQRLERMLARLAMVFVNWHNRKDSLA